MEHLAIEFVTLQLEQIDTFSGKTAVHFLHLRKNPGQRLGVGFAERENEIPMPCISRLPGATVRLFTDLSSSRRL